VTARARPSREGPAGATIELATLGTGLVLVMVLLARLPSWRAELATFQALLLVAFAFYGAALWLVARGRHAPAGLLAVLSVALAARLALLPTSPSLSDDIYRYIWEGRVVAHGFDPYRLEPLADALRPLRDARLFPRINHPQLASIYPPLALAGFALVERISATVWAMKLWILLHEMGLVVALLLWGVRSEAGLAAAIAYAWNPLVLVEFAGSGHDDPTAMMWLVLALIWAERRPLASALALSAGALTKLAPLAALPFLMRSWPWRARLLALGLLGLGLGWYWAETRSAPSGLLAYWRTWRNNELVFDGLAAAVGPSVARWVAVALVAAVAAVTLALRASAAPATWATLRTGLLVSPVAHPWYFAWAVLTGPRVRLSFAPWALLSLTCVLSYGLFAPPTAGSSFHLPLPWRGLEYGVPAGLAIALAVARGAKRDSAGAHRV